MEIIEENFRSFIGLCGECSAIFKMSQKYQYKGFTGGNIISIDPVMVTTCPNCGNSNATTKNSLYNFVEETFSYLKSLKLPELFLLKDALNKFQQGDKANEDVKDLENAVNSVAPEILKSKSFIPEKYKEIFTWVTILISLVTAVIPLLTSKDNTPTTVIFNTINNTEIVEPKVVNDTSNRKLGRNDQCPCGSGIKFKKCHGKP